MDLSHILAPCPDVVAPSRLPSDPLPTPLISAVSSSTSLHHDLVRIPTIVLPAPRFEPRYPSISSSSSIRHEPREYHIIHKHIQAAYKYAKRNVNSKSYGPITLDEATTLLSSFTPFADHCSVCKDCGSWFIRRTIHDWHRASTQPTCPAPLFKMLYARGILECNVADVCNTLKSFDEAYNQDTVDYQALTTFLDSFCVLYGDSATVLKGYIRCLSILPSLTRLCFNLDIHYLSSPPRYPLASSHSKSSTVTRFYNSKNAYKPVEIVGPPPPLFGFTVCEIEGCRRSFAGPTQKESMARHRKSHDKVLQCKGCIRTFKGPTAPANLKKHQLRRYGDACASSR